MPLPTLHSGFPTLFIVAVLTGCSNTAAQFAAPDGYAVFFSSEFNDVRVQLSVPQEFYNSDPAYYDQIQVSTLSDSEALADFQGQLENPLGLVFSMAPDGLTFQAPLHFQIAWSGRDIEAREGYELRIITKDAGSHLWEPISGEALDLAAGSAAGWIKHFSSYAFAFVPKPIDSLALVSGAREGQEFTFRADQDLAGVTAVCATCDTLIIENDEIRIKASSGLHHLDLTVPFYRNWSQDFYVAPSTSYSDWDGIAQRFQPTLHFSENFAPKDGRITCHKDYRQNEPEIELYWPQTIDSIFRPQVELGIWNNLSLLKLAGDKAATFLAEHATTSRVIDQQTSMAGLRKRSGLDVDLALYWQVETDVDIVPSIGTSLSDRVFLTYWMFYPWDWKSPDLRSGKHSFDRESLSVELHCTDATDPSTCNPDAVWYAGHLAEQRLYLLNPADGNTVLGRWEGDALRVPWEVVEREADNEDSPTAYIAYGSHALYPRPAIYYVDPNIVWTPASIVGNKVFDHPGGGTEAACGDSTVIGPTGSGLNIEYALRPLDLGEIRSDSGAIAALLFSGDFVDGLINGKFPPFLDRFNDLDKWAQERQSRNNREGWCDSAACLDCLPDVASSYCINATLITCDGGRSSRTDCAAYGQSCKMGACVGDDDSKGETQLVSGWWHNCVRLPEGAVRCWGNFEFCGYGSTESIGDNETPASAGDVDIGEPVVFLSSGGYHTCARTVSGGVRCWGHGMDGQLGNQSTMPIGDNETPSSVGDIDIGSGNVIEIANGSFFSCALFEGGAVRCWGQGANGQLGNGHTYNVGDNETPGSGGDVAIGGAVVHLAAGAHHTCALLETGSVRCWGGGNDGQLGYGNTAKIGDDELPYVAGDVDVGGTVVQITGGDNHTCARLANGGVRCWGRGADGVLGYGNIDNIGDDEVPASVGMVDIGGPAKHVEAGSVHTCAILVDGAVRCWGEGSLGRLGYGNEYIIGDDETPSSAGNVDVGGVVKQIGLGRFHTCALLDDDAVRCWGYNVSGVLGYGNLDVIGDDETPASAGNVPYL
jgi:alpha-tubulin suppressor-like RCC1 family protein